MKYIELRGKIIFRICSEFSVMFRIFSNVQNLFRIFRICSEQHFQNLFRIFSNVQNLFRISSTKIGLFRISGLCSVTTFNNIYRETDNLVIINSCIICTRYTCKKAHNLQTIKVKLIKKIHRPSF